MCWQLGASFSWQQWQPNQALRSGCLPSCQADGHKQTTIQTARVWSPKPQTTATDRPARGMHILGMPLVPTQPLYVACWPRVCQGPCMRSADSTVASCHLSCISSISGEAPFFTILLCNPHFSQSSQPYCPACVWVARV